MEMKGKTSSSIPGPHTIATRTEAPSLPLAVTPKASPVRGGLGGKKSGWKPNWSSPPSAPKKKAKQEVVDGLVDLLDVRVGGPVDSDDESVGTLWMSPSGNEDVREALRRETLEKVRLQKEVAELKFKSTQSAIECLEYMDQAEALVKEAQAKVQSLEDALADAVKEKVRIEVMWVRNEEFVQRCARLEAMLQRIGGIANQIFE